MLTLLIFVHILPYSFAVSLLTLVVFFPLCGLIGIFHLQREMVLFLPFHTTFAHLQF